MKSRPLYVKRAILHSGAKSQLSFISAAEVSSLRRALSHIPPPAQSGSKICHHILIRIKSDK